MAQDHPADFLVAVPANVVELVLSFHLQSGLRLLVFGLSFAFGQAQSTREYSRSASFLSIAFPATRQRMKSTDCDVPGGVDCMTIRNTGTAHAVVYSLLAKRKTATANSILAR
jgi:hypothetical protein